MSASHGYSTMGGIEYGDVYNMEKTKKGKMREKREGTMLLSFFHTCASK